MCKPNLLLCFDAFGTLFKPKRSIIEQYGEVARQLGLVIPRGDKQLERSFLDAFKAESKLHPNYGRETSLGATKWWTAVIHNTFAPFRKSGQPLPIGLASALLHRFSSQEGYAVETGLVSAIRSLKQLTPSRRFNNIVVGVITNSDDRVPCILSSFGLNVSRYRFGIDTGSLDLVREDFDVDFHCISYDVGFEKPDRRIFDTADSLLSMILAMRYSGTTTTNCRDPGKWIKLYVGDEYEKDVVGSQKAGWKPIMLSDAQTPPGMTSIEDCQNDSIDQAFAMYTILHVNSIRQLSNWLMGA